MHLGSPCPCRLEPTCCSSSISREAQHSRGGFVSYQLVHLHLASNLFPSVHRPSPLKSFILDHTLHPLDFPHQLPWTTGSVSCGAPKRPLEARCSSAPALDKRTKPLRSPFHIPLTPKPLLRLFLAPQINCPSGFLDGKESA